MNFNHMIDAKELILATTAILNQNKNYEDDLILSVKYLEEAKAHLLVVLHNTQSEVKA